MVIDVDFLRAVFFKSLGHTFVLANQVDQLLICKRRSVRMKNIEPTIGDSSHGCVYVSAKRGSFEEELEDLRLKDFDKLQLTPPLDLKNPFSSARLPSWLNTAYRFFRVFVFFLRCWQDHSSIRPIYLEEDRVVAVRFVLEGSVAISESLVLVIGITCVDKMVQHHAGV